MGNEYYDGVEMFRKDAGISYDWLTLFLPYNPIIVEAGAYCGDETYHAARVWPHGRIFAFEPAPHSFLQLQKMVSEKNLDNVQIFNKALNSYNGKATLFLCYGIKGDNPHFEYASSFLPLKKEMEGCCLGPSVKVPCVVLDDWCEENRIDHIDILRLEVEGLELQVLESSPNILKNVKMIYVKSIIHPYRVSMTDYNTMKRYLEAANFVAVSHWYTTGIKGHALFFSRELFDAFFKKCAGVYEDM
jgi:FkbM family methyltransferase